MSKGIAGALVALVAASAASSACSPASPAVVAPAATSPTGTAPPSNESVDDRSLFLDAGDIPGAFLVSGDARDDTLKPGTTPPASRLAAHVRYAGWISWGGNLPSGAWAEVTEGLVQLATASDATAFAAQGPSGEKAEGAAPASGDPACREYGAGSRRLTLSCTDGVFVVRVTVSGESDEARALLATVAERARARVRTTNSAAAPPRAR